MSFDQFHEAPRAPENRAVFTAYDPQTARSTTMHGTGYSLENANSEHVSKGWVTNLALTDTSGTGLLNQKKAYGIGQENRAVGPDNRAEGSETGIPKKGGVGPDNRAEGSTGIPKKGGIGPDNRADGSETGIPKKGGVGPDNRAEGSETGIPKKGGAGPDNRAETETGMPKNKAGADNRAVEGSESGSKKSSGFGPHNRAAADSEFGHKESNMAMAKPYITMGIPLEQLKKA
jgi:hypothetical protein